MARLLTIGMLKAVPAKWEIEENWELFVSQFRRHRDDGIQVFITPECFLDGYAATEEDWTPHRFARVAQEVATSPYIRRLQQMARRAKTCIAFGFSEILEGYFYNTALLIDAQGRLAGKYHKTHLQHHDQCFAPGQELPVFDLEWGRAGMAICADRRWPETLRTLRLKGAEICLLPTYGMHHLDNEWWMRTRAYENQMFVCFAHPEVALIADPRGRVAAKLESNRPDVLVHQVDLEEVRDDNHLAHRRPELYGVLAQVDHPSRQASYAPPAVPRQRRRKR